MENTESMELPNLIEKRQFQDRLLALLRERLTKLLKNRPVECITDNALSRMEFEANCLLSKKVLDFTTPPSLRNPYEKEFTTINENAVCYTYGTSSLSFGHIGRFAI